MNLYDTKQISCVKCEKPIGEIDYEAVVIFPRCGKCANLMPKGDEILHTSNHLQNNPSVRKLIQTIQY
jgi:hypothetical protein